MWWWLAIPVTLTRAPIDPAAKLLCVSYAPFRDAQTPLVSDTQVPPEQIAQDLAQLAKISNCVRTYSIENGLDRVPEFAAKVGLKVIQASGSAATASRTSPRFQSPLPWPRSTPA